MKWKRSEQMVAAIAPLPLRLYIYESHLQSCILYGCCRVAVAVIKIPDIGLKLQTKRNETIDERNERNAHSHTNTLTHGSTFIGCGMFCWLFWFVVVVPAAAVVRLLYTTRSERTVCSPFAPHIEFYAQLDHFDSFIISAYTRNAGLMRRFSFFILPAVAYLGRFTRTDSRVAASFLCQFYSPLNGRYVRNGRVYLFFFLLLVLPLCERQLRSIICFKLRLLVDCYWGSSLLFAWLSNWLLAVDYYRSVWSFAGAFRRSFNVVYQVKKKIQS